MGIILSELQERNLRSIVDNFYFVEHKKPLSCFMGYDEDETAKTVQILIDLSEIDLLTIEDEVVSLAEETIHYLNK